MKLTTIIMILFGIGVLGFIIRKIAFKISGRNNVFGLSRNGTVYFVGVIVGLMFLVIAYGFITGAFG